MNTENVLVANQFETIDTADINRIAQLLFKQYHFELNSFAPTFINRRIVYSMQKHKVSDVDEFLNRLLITDFFEKFLFDLSVQGTEFFRDTSVWENLFKIVIENIKPNSEYRVWFPDCGNGEDLYSFTILLKQFGLYDKCSITASNISNEKIAFIKQGMYEGKYDYSDISNYNKQAFLMPTSSFFSTIDTAIKVNNNVLINVNFLNSNASKKSNTKMYDLVIFRNAMIHYSKEYQIKVLENITESIKQGGLLIIGVNEQLLIHEIKNAYNTISEIDKIFQKS